MRIGRATGRAGLTLTELAVILAVVAVLIALLLPTIGRIRDSAQTTICLTNQRNLMLACRMYAMNNESYMPSPNWCGLDWGPNGNINTPGWLYNPRLRRNVVQDSEQGVLWPYTLDHAVFRCPCDAGPWPQGAVQQTTSYLMNGAVDGYGTRYPSYKITDFKSDAIIMWEVDAYNAWAGNDGSSYPPEPITHRHLKGAAVGCVDGHCEILSQDQWNVAMAGPPSRLWCNPGSIDGH